MTVAAAASSLASAGTKDEETKSAATLEFNQLANLIGLAAEERDTKDQPDFKLNLFPDAVHDTASIGSYQYKDSSNMIEIDLKEHNRAYSE